MRIEDELGGNGRDGKGALPYYFLALSEKKNNR